MKQAFSRPLRRGGAKLCRSSKLGLETLEPRLALSATLLNLGVLDFARIVLPGGSGDAWLQFTATRTGLLSALRTTGDSADSNEGTLRLYEKSSGSTVQIAESSGRIDAAVTAGQAYYLQIVAPAPGEIVLAADLLTTTATTWSFFGTTGDDTFEYQDAAARVILNGIPYQLPAGISGISFSGGDGRDQAVLRSSRGNESVSISPGGATLSLTGRTVTAYQTESVSAYVSSSAVGELIDSPGDDRVELRPNEGRSQGPGFEHQLIGPAIIHAYSRNGGRDSATLYDSPGDDQATLNPVQSVVRGNGFYNRAKLFADVTVVSTSGGFDSALVIGSAGNDYLSGDLSGIRMKAGGADLSVSGYRLMVAASGGGADVAEIEDSPGDDFFTAFPGDAALFNDVATVRLQQFRYVHAYARNGGQDLAHFYDSPGDDTFVARPDWAAMSTPTDYTRVKFFETVHAYAREGGTDTAWLYDSPGNDLLTARPYYTRLSGANFEYRVETFDRVYAVAGSGGSDLAEFHSSRGSDSLSADGTITDFLFAETGTAVQTRRFASEEVWLDVDDVVRNAVARWTVHQNEVRTVVNAADYYDPTDATLGFQAAIDALPAEGGVVVLPAGTFTLRAGLVLRSNVTLQGHPNGTTLVRTTHASTALTADARPGDLEVRLQSTAGFRVGDEIGLFMSGADAPIYRRVAAVLSDRLILDRPLDGDSVFSSARSATVANLFALVRTARTNDGSLIKNVVVENLTLDGNAAPGYVLWRALADAVIHLRFTENSAVRDVQVRGSFSTGIVFEQGRDNLVERAVVENPRRDGIALGWERDTIIRDSVVRGAGFGAENSGWGEGILVNGGWDIRVEGNLTENNVGKGLHPAGDLTIGGIWLNNVSRYNGINGFHYCNNNFAVWAVNNDLYGNGDSGIGGLGLGGDFGDRFNVIRNNRIHHNQRYGILINGGMDNYIQNNFIYANSQRSPGRFSEILVGAVYTTVISGNTVQPTVVTTVAPPIETRYLVALNVVQ
ncbi:right-handed parallel beta-helix repeat-containing protein [Thermopirellula anaerolimosa]